MTFLKVEKKSTTWLTQKSWYWWELPITDRKCHFCLMFIIYLLTGGQEWLLDTLMSTWGGSDLARDQPGKTLQPFIMNQSSNLKQEPMVDRSDQNRTLLPILTIIQIMVIDQFTSEWSMVSASASVTSIANVVSCLVIAFILIKDMCNVYID